VSTPVQEKNRSPLPEKDLSGLMPYLRRYTWAIVLGLFGVLMMGIIGNVIPLATGVIEERRKKRK